MSGLGLALSGGGHRAALFALGALLYVADSGRNVDVTSISSVSGGSLTNGYVAQTGNFREQHAEEFHATAARLAHRLEGGTLMRTMPSSTGRIVSLLALILVALVWLIPTSVWLRMVLFLVAIGVWAALGLAPLFVTSLAKLYVIALAITLLAAGVAPWLVPLPDAVDVPFARFVLFVLAFVAWASVVWSRRGAVCADAYRQLLFSPKGRPTLLREINDKIDHVLCATDLQSAEQVYFSQTFVYGYQFGKGEPKDLPLHVAVQSSANLPFAFPPRWLPTENLGFPSDDSRAVVPRHLVLTDGGVYDNMADQWPQGFDNRIRRWPELQAHHEPDTLVVVNASEGLGWQQLRRSRIPAIGGILALLRIKDILYDQTTAQRRSGLVGRFDRAILSGEGMKGALVHIPQSPFDVATAFRGSREWPDRASRSEAVLAALGDTRLEWDGIADADAAVATVLSGFGTKVAARLLRHGYVLAMANLHVILNFPLRSIPPVAWFEALASGRVERRPDAPIVPGPTQAPISKIQPKLRMFAGGSTEVNAVRAELASALIVAKQDRPAGRVRGDLATPGVLDDLPAHVTTEEAEADPKAKAHVFITVNNPAGDGVKLHAAQSGRRGDLVAATVPLADIDELASRTDVAYVELGESLAQPVPEITDRTPSPPDPGRWRVEGDHPGGRGVLVGIVDVGGLDFSHTDFLDENGTTRFVRIWDQGGNARRPPSAPGRGGFDYGAEFTQQHLNEAIAASARLHLPAWELERQSQRIPGSHGTHVASIAGGTAGMCPKAFLAGVVVSLSPEDLDRRGTFSDSTRIAQAIDYLGGVADRLRDEHGLDEVPLSINISLGTNGHAHDGTSAVSRWIDSELSLPGRCVCIAAGNAGQHVPEFEGDLGWVMGRVHTSNTVKSGQDVQLEWVVVGNGVADISENELELWYGAQDHLEVSVQAPTGEMLGPIGPREFKQNERLRDGSFVSIYNEPYHPDNGANYIAIYLSPLLSKDAVIGVPAGTWIVHLRGLQIRDGRFHGWIERDDPRRLGRVGPKEAWRFPSFFSGASYVGDSTVGSLACGHHVVSVANFNEATGAISVTSSQGPTRDARNKPDVAAPGSEIVAAKGFTSDPNTWVAMSGTSMASPYVAGVAALMLAVEPRLTAAQIAAIIQRTAHPVASEVLGWQGDAGFGVIDPAACLAEAATVNKRIEVP